MPSKQKNTKRQRTPRVVSNPKVVHRTGGRKPQERRITNAGKVLGIQTAVKTAAMNYLTALETPVDGGSESYLDYLVGFDTMPFDEETYILLKTEDPSVAELAASMPTIEKAFYTACKMVPDSQFAYEGDFQAVRGRTFLFFTLLKEQDENRAKEAAAKRAERNRNRRNGNRASAHVAKLVRSAN